MENKQLTPVDRLKNIISAESVQDQFKNALAGNKDLFTASLVDIYASDTYLQKCDPKSVVMEALKAATLKLPINKNLGFAYIVPYKGKAQMQIGYKGYLQLAQRTGQYRFINADIVFEGETVVVDKLRGNVSIEGVATSDTSIGYFAYIETLNGFQKAVYWTKERILAHAKRYSESYRRKKGAWVTNLDEMGIKTVLINLLSHYGIMSVEMISAMTADSAETPEQEAAEHANQNIIDIQPEPTEEESKTAQGPDF